MPDHNQAEIQRLRGLELRRTEWKRNKAPKDRSIRTLSRQRRILDLYVQGKTYTEISNELRVSVDVVSYAVESVKTLARTLLESHGLGLNKLIPEHIKPKLRATTTKFFQRDGIITDTAEVDDNKTQMDAIDMIIRLGRYDEKDEEESTSSSQVNIVIDMPRPMRNVTPDV